METGTIIIFVAGFVLFLVAAVFAANIKNILGVRLHRPHLELKDCEDFPEHLRELFSPAEQSLRQLGFEPVFCMLTDDLMSHRLSSRWAMVYFNKAENTYADVSFTTHQDEMPGYEVDFNTIYSDGTLLLTVNCRAYSVFTKIPHTILVDPCVDNLEDQYRAHTDRAQELQNEKTPMALSSAVFLSRHKLALNAYMDALLEEGWIKPHDDEYVIGFRRAFSIVRKMLRGEQRRIEVRHKKELEDREKGNIQEVPLAAEVEAYQRTDSISRRHSIGWLLKTGVFLASVVLFSIAFGMVFDFKFVLILFGVLLFHELGHLLAMAVFRYKDLQILFIPFFGAAAIGHEQQARVYQRVIVALMGPLPGLIVGYGLLYVYMQTGIALLYEISLVMLVLNYLNLLPLMPLDGGQVMKLILLERFPRGQAVFSALSALLFFAGALVLSEPVFWVLGFFMLFAFPAQWREGTQLKKLQQALRGFPDTRDEDKRLAYLFQILRDKAYEKLRFPGKYQLIRKFKEQLQQSHAGWGLITTTLAAYVFILLFPLLVAVGMLVGQGNGFSLYTGLLSAITSTGLEQPDWEVKLAAATTLEERWQISMEAAQWYASVEDDDNSRKYFQLAMDEARHLDDTDLRMAATLEGVAAVTWEIADSRRYYNQALILREQHQGKQHLDIARNLEAQAQTYAYQGEEAEQGIQLLLRAISIRKQLQPFDSEMTAATLQNLATFYVESSQPQLAEQALSEAIAIQRQADTPESRYSMVASYSMLAMLQAGQQHYDDAEQTLLQQLALLGAMDKRFAAGMLPQAYSELGWLYYSRGRLSEAIRMMEQARSAHEEMMADYAMFLSKDTGILPYLLDMAFMYSEQGNKAEAGQLFAKAQSVMNDAGMTMQEYLENLEQNIENADRNTRDAWRSKRWRAHVSIIKQEYRHSG